MRTRQRFVPILEAQAGMLLSTPCNIVEHGYLSLSLPAGHALTQENLSQLAAHHADYIYITQDDTRSDEQVAVDAALSARRVMQIFDGADLTDPNMAALFDQVLGYRSA